MRLSISPTPSNTPSNTPTNTASGSPCPTFTPTPSITPSPTCVRESIIVAANQVSGTEPNKDWALSYSYDGLNWSPSTNGGIFSAGTFTGKFDIATDGDLWITVGGSNNRLGYSYDGITWSANTSVNTLADSLLGIASNGNMWIACGSKNNRGVILYSNDGFSWNNILSSGATGQSTFYDAAWNGNMWLVGGNIGAGTTGATGVIQYSYNGLNWSSSTNADTVFNGQVRGFASNGSRWVAAGATLIDIAYSDDGIIWSGSSSGQTLISYHAIWDGGKFIVGGQRTSGSLTSFATILYSYDGVSWFSGNGANDIFTICSSIIYNGSYYVAGGTNLDPGSPPRIYGYSTDGINWSASSGNTSGVFTFAGQGIASIPEPYLIPGIYDCGGEPTPTPSFTATQTNTPTPEPSPEITPTNTTTQTNTPSMTATQTITPTPSATPPIITPSNTATQTNTPSMTATQTITPTPSITATQTPSNTTTQTPSQTTTNTQTATQTITPTPSPTKVASYCIEAMNTGFGDYSFNYVNCDNVLTFITIPGNDSGLLFVYCGSNPQTQSGTGYAVQQSTECVDCGCPSEPPPTPSMTQTNTPTNTQTPSQTQTNTPTPSITPTRVVEPCNILTIRTDTSLDVPITGVDVNGVPVIYLSGDTFPIIPTDPPGYYQTLTTGTTQTVNITYGSNIAGQRIVMMDCGFTSYCCDLNPGGGTCTFTGVDLSCGCFWDIQAYDGTC